MAKLRPYLKYFIVGGNICGIGGTMLMLGAMLVMIMRFMGSNITVTLSVVFTIIGVVALIIGITLLFRGVNDRKFWLQAHRFDQIDSESVMPREQSMRRAESPVHHEARFCPFCGNQLPNLPNISFCPKCGESLI